MKKRLLSGILAAIMTLGTVHITALTASAAVSVKAAQGCYKNLTSAQKSIYGKLLEYAKKIANGTADNSDMLINTVNEADLKRALEACVNDYPQYWYWYGLYYTYSYSLFTNETRLRPFVSNAYRAYPAEDPAVNPIALKKSALKSAYAVLDNAQAIADKYSSLPAYQQVIKFADEIASLNSYNDYAASHSSEFINLTAVDTRPWNIIYVFDKNSSTNTVCEGYAKAFKYLCDLNGIECYIAGGTEKGGAHMWNIVVLDGKSYHVDVTFGDTSTGNDIEMFKAVHPYILSPALSSNASAFTTPSKQHKKTVGLTTYTYTFESKYYVYNSVTAQRLPANIRTVSTAEYKPSANAAAPKPVLDSESASGNAPAKVKTLKASARAKTSVTLKWSKVANADGYRIKQYKSGKWKVVKTVKDGAKKTAKIKGLKAGKKYKFKVCAYKGGKNGASSKALTVYTKK